MARLLRGRGVRLWAQVLAVVVAVVGGVAWLVPPAAPAAPTAARPLAPVPVAVRSPDATVALASARSDVADPPAPPVADPPTEPVAPVAVPPPPPAAPPPPPPAAPSPPPAPPAATGSWGSAIPLGRPPAPVAEPVTVAVPAIGVASELIPLGVLADGTLDVPSTAHQAGWYAGGVRPGAPGAAVLAGHVDLGGQAGVFQRLGELGPGDAVTVTAADGTTHDFTVDRVDRHPKDAFPSLDVYGPEPGPVLRLITCGGSFDRATGHYRDNIVVTARA